MALSDSTVWEVRSATGNDANGGGFVTGASGTDYSQQASPQFALTGVTSSGSGDTVLSAAAATTMVGNIAQLISGSNGVAGFYEIISVVAGVSITFSKNNSGGSICSGTLSSGVINIGGALQTLTALNAAINWNQTAYLKGTFTLTSSLALTLFVDASHGTRPIHFIGYSSARGTGRCLWTTSTNSVDLIQFTSANGYVFENIEFSSTAGTPGNGLNAKTGNNSGGILLINCLLHGFAQGIRGNWQADFSFSSIVLFKCAVYSCTGVGVFNDGFTAILGSYIHDNGGDGVGLGSNTGAPIGVLLVWRSVVKSNGGKGINDAFESGSNTARFPIVIESDVLNNTGDGISTGTNTATALILLNSIVDGNGGYGVDLAVNKWMLQLIGSIAWRANSSGDVNNALKSSTDVTLSSDPFTDRSTDDFTLNATGGGGADCKGIGEPASFPPS